MGDSISRREFVHGSAAGLTLGALWSSRAARALESPNEKIVVGVMGTNGRGGALAREFAELPGSAVAYVCDVDQRVIDRTVKNVADRASMPPKGVKDFREILDDKSVDALVIAAPDHWHGPATILGCTAGKHVYVEKPASHNGREGELMIEAARKHNRVVQLGTQRRSSPGVTAAIEKVRSGAVGRVLFARGWINSTRPSIGRGQEAPVPDWLDYTLWQGPAPQRPYRDNVIHYHWHWFWDWGTGELGNNGIHALDLCRWGMAVDYPKKVVCGGGKYFFDDDQETPDTQIATFDFGDKAINWEHRTWHRRGFEGQSWGCAFYGDEGTLLLTNGHFAVLDRSGKEVERQPVTVGELEHLNNFLDCIRSGKRPNADVEEGVKSTALCHLGNVAYRSGQTVLFDPSQGGIQGNPQQRELWTREYRPGWEPKV